MKKFLKYSIWVTVTTFSILGFAYAASTITSLWQTINDGDIIWAWWFNEVSSVLGWTKVDGKMCTFAAGKISCVNNLPSSSWGASNWDKNWSNISYTVWNVGIWVSSPTKKLDINGWMNTDSLSIWWVDINDLFLKNLPDSYAILMNFWEWQWYVDSSTTVTKPVCSAGYSPKIQVSLDWMFMSWNVNNDDLIWTWYVDSGSSWQVSWWNYDCWTLSGWKMKRNCWDNVKTKISYTTFCVKWSGWSSSSSSWWSSWSSTSTSWWGWSWSSWWTYIP